MRIPRTLTAVDLNSYPNLLEVQRTQQVLDETSLTPATFAELCRLQSQQSSNSIDDAKVVAINRLHHHAQHTYAPRNSRKRRRSNTNMAVATPDLDGGNAEGEDVVEGEATDEEEEAAAGSSVAVGNLWQEIKQSMDDLKSSVDSLKTSVDDLKADAALDRRIDRERQSNKARYTFGEKWAAVTRRGKPTANAPPLPVLTSMGELLQLTNGQLREHIRLQLGADADMDYAMQQDDHEGTQSSALLYSLAHALGVELEHGDLVHIMRSNELARVAAGGQ